jgi:hypothetical protein
MVIRPVCPGIRPPSGTHDQHLFLSTDLQAFATFWYGTPSLMKGRVCNLLVQVLLGLASAVTLACKSRRTRDHILLFHLRLGSLFVASHDLQGYS